MSKDHVLRKHPSAAATKHIDGWDVRAGEILLGQGKTAVEAWWDATLFCYPEWGKSPAESISSPAPTPAWPFPCSAHEEPSC